jgi:hypothetical protein
MINKSPLKILEQDNQFKATTSISLLRDKSSSIRQNLSYLELDYATLVKTVRDTLMAVRSNTDKKKDPRIYWLIGDYIIAFLRRINDLGYYLVRQNQTLGKSIGISRTSVGKILSFRIRFSSIAIVNSAIPWAKYRENKVSVRED